MKRDEYICTGCGFGICSDCDDLACNCEREEHDDEA